MINDNMSFSVLNENGEKTECDILFSFDNEETGKSYVVYTDNSFDNEGKIQVFASTYDPSSEEQVLLPIESEKEWKIIEIILEEIMNEINRGDDNDTVCGI